MKEERRKVIETKELLGDVQKELERRNYICSPTTMRKNNLDTQGIALKLNPDDVVATIIYEESLQDLVRRTGVGTIEELCDELIFELSISCNLDVFNDIAGKLNDRDYILEHVILSICNAEWNKEMLEELPHYILPGTDLAVFPRVEINDGYYSRITNEQIKLLGLDFNEIIFRGKEKLEEMHLVDIFDLSGGKGLYVVTNVDKIQGAVLVVSDKVMENVLDILGVDKCWVIPSSVHEVLVCRIDLLNYEALCEMIPEVNAMSVRETDQLSDHPYIYERGKGLRDGGLEDG